MTQTFFRLTPLMMNASLTKPGPGAPGNIVFDVTFQECFYSEINALGLLKALSPLAEDNDS